MKLPPPLRQGDTVAIVSPATVVRSDYVRGAAKALEARGFRARIMPHALGPVSGSYAAPARDRVADLKDALLDDSVRAILCARGGYGCVHLLEHVSPDFVAARPKHLAGFSDVSALHALWHRAGLMSLHAPMAKHLTLLPPSDPCTEALFSLLTDPSPRLDYRVEPHPLDICGTASGRLAGGNLAVLSHLIGTPWDTLIPADGEDVILFIEDVGEAIYATERMLWQLKLAGAIERVKGIIAGQFTGAKPDLNFPSTTAMIGARLREWGVSCPVAASFPSGHVDRNLPLPLGAEVTLSVTPEGTSLHMNS